VTVIASCALVGWMLTTWLETPLKRPSALENSVLMVWTPDAVGVHGAETPPVELVGVDPMMPMPSKKNDALPPVTPVPVCAPKMVGVPTFSTGGNRSATVTTSVVKAGWAVSPLEAKKAGEAGTKDGVTVSPPVGVHCTFAVDVVLLIGLSVPVPITF